MEKFLHLLLFLYPFILPASSCIGVGSGCRRNGLIFGGRLMLSANTGMNFGNLPEVNGNRVFIFQSPPQMRNFLRPSAGRGQIWIGRSSCAGTVPGHCPSSETPPCLDSSTPCMNETITPPCSFALNVNEKDVLTFTWERPTCVPENEPLTYSYTFWMDGVTRTETTTDTQKTFSNFFYGSKYFFEVNVATSKGSFSDYISKASPAYEDDTPLTFLEVTMSSVTVSWPIWSETTDKGLGPIAEYIIQYRLKGDSEFSRIRKGLANQHRIDNLISGATYEFQVIVVKSNPTEDEEEDPSAIQEVQIKCPAPTDARLSLRSDYRSSDNSVAIYASWSVGISTFCAAGLDQTLTVQLLRDGCNMPNLMTSDETISIIGGETRDYTLRKTPAVLPNSLYSVTITVRNTLGTADHTQSIQTADAVPTQLPELLEPMATNSQITFRWNEPPCEGRNGEITNYEYRYLVWQEGSTQPMEETGVTSNMVIIFNNYDLDSRYEFYVRAMTAEGAGTPDTFAVIDPPRYIDATPLTFSDVTSGSIRVTWAAWDENVDFGQGPVVEYILFRRLKTAGSIFEQVYRGSGLSYVDTTVQADQLYEFRIKLVKSNPQVEGPPSSIQQSIACAGLGDLIPRLETTRLNRGSVSLDVSWEIPPMACGVTNQSLIVKQLDKDGCYYTGYEERTALEESHRSHSLTGMQPNSEYNVTLQVQTSTALFSVSEKIRTAETEPTGTPRMKEKRKVGRVAFWWEPLPCGERNGDVSYHYYMVVNGIVEEGDIRRGSRLKTIMGLNEGDRYMFKVRAFTTGGNGDYTSDRMKTFHLG